MKLTTTAAALFFSGLVSGAALHPRNQPKGTVDYLSSTFSTGPASAVNTTLCGLMGPSPGAYVGPETADCIQAQKFLGSFPGTFTITQKDLEDSADAGEFFQIAGYKSCMLGVHTNSESVDGSPLKLSNADAHRIFALTTPYDSDSGQVSSTGMLQCPGTGQTRFRIYRVAEEE